MATRVDAARLLVYRAASNAGQGTAAMTEASMAKLFGNVAGRAGFNMEAAGAQPVVSMNPFKGLGTELAEFARRLRYLHTRVSKIRDGFQEESVGGEVLLREDVSAVLDYPINEYIWDGGSVVPTSLGVNPSLSIYALAARNATALAARIAARAPAEKEERGHEQR